MESKEPKNSDLPPAPPSPSAGSPEAVKAPAKDPKKPIQVVATQPGYYEHRRIETGMKFNIKNEQEFSMNWMKDLSGHLPTKAMLDKVEAKKAAAKKSKE